VLRPSDFASRFEALRGSALVAALEERLHAEPHLRLRFFCSPYHRDSALFPFVDQLGRTSGFARDDMPAAKLQKFETLLAPAAPPNEDVAFLADLLSLPASERHPLPDLSPQRKKERILEALIRQLERFGKNDPGFGCLCSYLRSSGYQMGITALYVVVCEALVLQHRSGIDVVAEGLTTVGRTDERFLEAELYRLKARELLARGAAEAGAEAQSLLGAALSTARRQGARALELRAARDLARLWRDQGRHAEARDLLTPVYGWFTEGFDTPDLKEAKTLLDELR
jgi:hypothetical protein